MDDIEVERTLRGTAFLIAEFQHQWENKTWAITELFETVRRDKRFQAIARKFEEQILRDAINSL
jgi:hypothetical protein